jgi:hypothetical protein
LPVVKREPFFDPLEADPKVDAAAAKAEDFARAGFLTSAGR